VFNLHKYENSDRVKREVFYSRLLAGRGVHLTTVYIVNNINDVVMDSS